MLQHQQYDIFITEIFSVNAEPRKGKKKVSSCIYVHIQERRSEIGSLKLLTSTQIGTTTSLQRLQEQGWKNSLQMVRCEIFVYVVKMAYAPALEN